jgi:hypothetical protein
MAVGFKSGGRKKGTPNKATTITREILNDIAEGLRPNIARDLAALEPKDRLQIWLKLIEFVVPKLSSVDMNLTAPQIQSIEDTLIRLSQDNE